MSNTFQASPCAAVLPSSLRCNATIVTRLGYCPDCGTHRREYDQEQLPAAATPPAPAVRERVSA